MAFESTKITEEELNSLFFNLDYTSAKEIQTLYKKGWEVKWGFDAECGEADRYLIILKKGKIKIVVGRGIFENETDHWSIQATVKGIKLWRFTYKNYLTYVKKFENAVSRI